jgi:hypothetical protein
MIELSNRIYTHTVKAPSVNLTKYILLRYETTALQSYVSALFPSLSGYLPPSPLRLSHPSIITVFNTK